MVCHRLKRRNSLEKKNLYLDSKGSKGSKSPPNHQAEDSSQLGIKLSKTNPKASRLSSPRALNRMAAPTSISLPPNPLSNISWPKEESSADLNPPAVVADNPGHSAAGLADSIATGIPLAGARPNPTLATQPGLRIPAPNELNSSQRFVAQQHALQRHQLKKNSLNRQSSGTQAQLKQSTGPRPLLPNSNPRREPGAVLSTGPPVQFPNLEAQFPPQTAIPAATFFNYLPQQPAVNVMPFAPDGNEMESFIEKYMNDTMFLNDFDALPESGPYGTFTDDQMAILANHMPLDRLP
ncbi:hypothetical protein DSO57_1019444 [Entomophthora muscae]|nr:hypothetical protein DSO57_1019444 [Entomophthora muscae]